MTPKVPLPLYMKLLADENFPPTLISYLQKKHHDIKRIQRSTRGISDISVRERTIKENRVILSFDKDFLKTEVEESFSVIVFDFPYMRPKNIIPYMNNAVSEITKLKKRKRYFTAIYSVNGLKLSRE